MAAGDRVHCLGVLRLVIGEAFDRKAVVEFHKGIEDKKEETCWSQVESVEMEWKELKKTLGAEDFQALLRIVEKVEKAASGRCPMLKHSNSRAYDDKRPDAGSGIPSLV